jgi:hypothetical protein
MKKIVRRKVKKAPKKGVISSKGSLKGIGGRPTVKDPDEYITHDNVIVPPTKPKGRRAYGRPKGENYDTALRKKKFLAALSKSYGIVAPAAKATGISRDIHTLWMRDDPEYRTAVLKIKDDTHDFVESRILKAINDGVPSILKYYTSTQMRHRGYTERVEQVLTGSNGGPVQLAANVDVSGKIETYSNEVTPNAVVSIIKELVGDDNRVKQALEKLKHSK